MKKSEPVATHVDEKDLCAAFVFFYCNLSLSHFLKTSASAHSLPPFLCRVVCLFFCWCEVSQRDEFTVSFFFSLFFFFVTLVLSKRPDFVMLPDPVIVALEH